MKKYLCGIENYICRPLNDSCSCLHRHGLAYCIMTEVNITSFVGIVLQTIIPVELAVPFSICQYSTAKD